MEKLKCTKCNQSFWCQVTSMNVPGGKDQEYIYCPYCNLKNGSVITSGFVYTYKETEKIKM